uniref:Uncharacterized protein n=1 Tax=Anguilla anguilla TaxID=7936 RepID=A0A0E9W2H6_ANGAN
MQTGHPKHQLLHNSLACRERRKTQSGR